MTEQAKPKPTQYVAVAPAHGFYQCDKWNASNAIRALVRRCDRSEDLSVSLYRTGDEFEIDCFSIRSTPLVVLGEHVIPKKVTKAIRDANEALDECIEDLWGDDLYDYEA